MRLYESQNERDQDLKRLQAYDDLEVLLMEAGKSMRDPDSYPMAGEPVEI